MRIHELTESYLSREKGEVESRFNELGIEAAYEYFIGWIYNGAFNLPFSKLDRYEQAFYLINSVLPPNVLQSYRKLPTMYRGFKFNQRKLNQIQKDGLPIQSRIMAWSPEYNHVVRFYTGNNDWVIIKHEPKLDEVLLSLNSPTMNFLHISPDLVANPGETIMSIPMLMITKDMVVVSSRHKPSYPKLPDSVWGIEAMRNAYDLGVEYGKNGKWPANGLPAALIRFQGTAAAASFREAFKMGFDSVAKS